MLKFSVVFYFCLMLISLLVFAVIWFVLVNMGVFTSLTDFAGNFNLEVAFPAGAVFRWYSFIGLLGVVVWSIVTVLLTLLFNLVNDVTGGIEVVLAEREQRRSVPDLSTAALTLALARLAAVELGAQLVAAALPALGDLLDGFAQRLEAVQLSRARALGPAGAGSLGLEGLDLLVEVAGQAPQVEQGLGQHPPAAASSRAPGEPSAPTAWTAARPAASSWRRSACS